MAGDRKVIDINEWNKRIYRDSEGNFIESDRLDAKELWEKFQIKSGPLFKDACWSEIPAKWAEDVRLFLTQAQKELGERIGFSQIKEKWCELVIYFSAKDKEAEKRFIELKKECTDRLIEKGVYPPQGEKDE